MNNWKTLGILLLLALMAYGCAGAGEKSSSDEVKAFFVDRSMNANFLGLTCTVPPV